MGLTFDETLDIPIGDLLTLIAIEQIKAEGAEEKQNDDFFALLEVR